MSNIINLTNRIAELSDQLQKASISLRQSGKTEMTLLLIERLEDELDEVSNQLDELTDFEDGHQW